jgi:hypothetical protein
MSMNEKYLVRRGGAFSKFLALRNLHITSAGAYLSDLRNSGGISSKPHFPWIQPSPRTITVRTIPIMSVLLETSAGDIVIDLLVDYSPKLCEK